MFDSKKDGQFEKSKAAQEALPASLSNIVVHTIPEEFYNGKQGNGMGGLVQGDGEKKPTGEIKPVNTAPISPLETGAPTTVTPTTQLPAMQITKPSSVHPMLVIVSVVVLLLVMGGGGYAYYELVLKKGPEVIRQPIQQPPVAIIEEVPVEETPTELTTSTPSIQTITKSFPLGLREYSRSLDTDRDELTDAEETEIYKSTFDKPDTDEDGYIDGLEVLNLYNPAGFKPVKLVETENIVAYTNTVFGYSVLAPKLFVRGNVDADGKEVFFTAQSGENFVITVRPNREKVPLKTWYETNAPQVIGEQVREITTKQGLKGLLSPDQLAIYIAREDVVYEVRYELGLETQARYLQTFIMMQNSFTFTTQPQYIPQETPFAPPAEVQFPIEQSETTEESFETDDSPALSPADALLQNSVPTSNETEVTSPESTTTTTSSTPEVTPSL